MQNGMLKSFFLGVVGLSLVAVPIADVQAQRSSAPEQPVPMYRIPGSAPEPDRTSRQGGLTERTFNTLTSIHQDIGEQRYAEAIDRLVALNERGRLTDYERAQIMLNLGFAYAVTDRTQLALQQFSSALQLEVLNHSETQNIFLMMGQLYAMEEQWDQAIRALTRYFYWEDKPSAETSMIVMAISYAQKSEYANALVWVKRAIENAREPRENWYQLQLSMENELRRFEEATNTLAMLISLWPEKPIYWEQLSGILMQMERENDSLAVLAMAYQRGLIRDEGKIINLVRFYQYRGAPFNAARIMRKGMDDGIIQPTRQNWELLATTYQAAEERREAIRALQRAAALADDGEIFIREAQLHASVDDWAGVQRAAQDAINKGGLRNPGRAWMMLAIAAYEAKNYQEALRGFRQATQFADTRQRATQWISYVNNEIRIQRALREGI